MKVVIGGANGLLGQRLVRALRARGDEVVALVRRAGGGAPWALGARLVEWDGRGQGAWAREVDGAQALVNLAGANVGGQRWNDAYKRLILESRVASTRACVEALRAAKAHPQAFLNASAVGYYGDRGDEELDESAAPGQDFLAGVCTAWEAEATEADALGVRTVLLRTGVVLAPPGDGGALRRMVPVFKAFAGGPLGTGRQWFPWIHVDDEVAMILFALDHPGASGPFNLCAPKPVTMGDFARALGRALHRPALAPVPAFALRLAVGEFAEVLLGGQRTLPTKARQLGFQFKFPDLSDALADLLRP